MKRLNIILSAVLAAQLVLAGALAWNIRDYAVAQPKQPLLAFERQKVDTIVIKAPDAGSLTLRKGTEGWSLPSYYHFPADASQVESFLVALGDLNPRLPVAITEAARQRFHVAQKTFERRITLKHGENILAQLYLGSSAGPSQAFARPAEGEAIYEVHFELWQASVEPDQWVAGDVLQQEVADIVRIDLPELTLQRKEDKWRLVGLDDGADTDSDKAAHIVQRLASLTFNSVKGKVDESTNDWTPELSYTLTLKDGRRVAYHFSKAKQGDGYLLRTSASDYVFKISKETVEALHELKRSALVMKSEDETVDKTAKSTSGGHTDNTQLRS